MKRIFVFLLSCVTVALASQGSAPGEAKGGGIVLVAPRVGASGIPPTAPVTAKAKDATPAGQNNTAPAPSKDAAAAPKEAAPTATQTAAPAQNAAPAASKDAAATGSKDAGTPGSKDATGVAAKDSASPAAKQDAPVPAKDTEAPATKEAAPEKDAGPPEEPAPAAEPQHAPPNPHAVYLFPMGYGLEQFLANHLASMEDFHVVTDPKLAGAILTDRIGPAFEQRLLDILPPAPEAAEPVAKKGGQDEGEQAPPQATVKVPRPGTMASFGRGKGNIFLVDVASRQVIWSTFQKREGNSAEELERAASRIAARFRKDMKVSEKKAKGVRTTQSEPSLAEQAAK